MNSDENDEKKKRENTKHKTLNKIAQGRNEEGDGAEGSIVKSKPGARVRQDRTSLGPLILGVKCSVRKKNGATQHNRCAYNHCLSARTVGQTKGQQLLMAPTAGDLEERGAVVEVRVGGCPELRLERGRKSPEQEANTSHQLRALRKADEPTTTSEPRLGH
ncbi:hypothetical protein CVT26_012164 [Gymnopilus dilepis]|uniref:Uncharacterized protein n=1 Tax=Gymnopilus dilepis TaxID=231916 RepID=A0A409WNL3_9AGAR|nr:hypothetical protein CVT26_012164 [Gymnopilus dilepis]